MSIRSWFSGRIEKEGVLGRDFVATKESYMRYEATNRRLTEKLVVILRKQVSLLWAGRLLSY
jgi:hypothetical protein